MNGEQLFLKTLKDYVNRGMSKNDLKTLISHRLKEVESKQKDTSHVNIVAEHRCGNKLTEKEVFYQHCLKCNESND